MAFPPKIPRFPLLLTLYFFCFPTQISSLSTVSISSIFNQTLVCALIPSSDRRSFLRCTVFPGGVLQIPLKSQNVSYSGIVGGNGFLCALRSQKSLSSPTSVMECWRFSVSSTTMSHKRIYRGRALSRLEAGDSHVCGVVNRSNTLKCWHWNPRSSVADDFVCGLDGNYHIFCSGDYANVIGKEPSGNYSVVASGTHHVCAISLNGSLDCWGNEVGMKPVGKFKDLAIGDDRSCAMHINGTVICWGVDDFRIPKRLKETYFTGIVGKESVFCGVVSSNYSLLCWGDEILGENFVVFGNVMPGTCTAHCPSCGPLPGYGFFCREGLMVCQPCAMETMDEGHSSPMVVPSLTQSSKSSIGGSRSSTWSSKLVVFLVVGCLGFMSLVASVVFFVVFRCDGGRASQVHVLGSLEETLQRPKPKLVKKRLSHMYSIDNGGNLEEFPLEVLLQVTNNFSEDHRMGRGSFGCVYHAILADGREVAIKRAELHSSQHRKVDKDTAFMAELEVLSRLNHKHLVKLIGFYEDTNERVLVYEFMSNSTLHHHLHKLKGNSLLASWPARLKVALDAARGIEYLHKYADPPIIHRDIKSSNILLDADWTAKVSDFGLSLMGPRDGESHLSIQPVGTFGYVDPEYYKLNQLTTKSDVYSFGVVLLELLSGYKAVHANEDGTPTNVLHFVAPYITRGEIHKVLDPCVRPPTPVEIEAVENLGYLAMDCVSREGRNRPTMSGVVSRLDRALAACFAPPTVSTSSNA